jgi:UDP-N-acetylmuramoyl-tripeptide--D-alanyl-D-alanine ligase
VIPLAVGELESLVGPFGGRFDARADEVTGVRIDSRLVEPGDLFVAVGAGSAFVDDALARGAAATLVPEDAFAAMAAIGRAVRLRSDARVVAVTGSTGKTSTKDILAALCAPVADTVAAEASFNNELGVPLTLCRLEPDTQVCIVELAMRGLGQIADLAEIAEPEIGIVTGVGPVHLELVGTLAAVAEAKAELIAALPPGGVAVVPKDVPELEPYLARDDVELRRFSPEDVVEARVEGDQTHAVVTIGGRRLELTFDFVARHQLTNAVAALHAYDTLGLPLDRAHEGASQIAFSRWRGDELPLEGGGLLINDAYNANPVSMRAALDHLVDRAGTRRRVAVLGEMAELGTDAPSYHREIGRHASQLGIDVLLAVGPLAAHYVEGDSEIPTVAWVGSAGEAVDAVEQLLRPGDCVLVKASRAVGLEAVAEALAGALPGATT